MSNSVPHKLLLLLLLWMTFPFMMSGQPESYLPGQDHHILAVFDSTFEKALYKGSFNISRHHISGLYLIKRVPDNSFRIIFTNELGMKFFDLEIGEKGSIVHFCYPSLKKRALLKLLENDFRLLFFPVTTIRMKQLRSRDPVLLRYGVKIRKGNFYYTFRKETGKILRIQTSKTLLGKTDLRLDNRSSMLPAHIRLDNSTIHLHIRMTLLPE